MGKLIEDVKVYNVWTPKCDCDSMVVSVNPDFYEENGTPICSECGEDLTYSHTEIEN